MPDAAYKLVTCAFCRKLFLKYEREIARWPRHYCNKACSGRARMGGTGVDLVGPVPAGIRRLVSDTPVVRVFTTRQCRCGEWITALGQRVPKTCGCPAPTRVFVSGPCHECGDQFTSATYTGATPGRYCSKTCHKRNRRRRDKQMRSKRIKTGARREVIDMARLAKRDGWRCHICKRKVTRKTWSHDHLIPLSDDAATHTYDNVALAHKRCNTLRSNTGAAQLLLIG